MLRVRALLLSAALALLGACADGYGYGPGGYSYYPDRYYGGYYSGFYDGFYGPIYGGYWGPGGFFYYSNGPNRPYLCDKERHFRHQRAEGFQHFRFQGRGDHAQMRTLTREALQPQAAVAPGTEHAGPPVRDAPRQMRQAHRSESAAAPRAEHTAPPRSSHFGDGERRGRSEGAHEHSHSRRR